MDHSQKMLKSLKSLPPRCVFDTMDSPVGVLVLVASDKGLHLIMWKKDWVTEKFLVQDIGIHLDENHVVIQKTKLQLKEYFSGKRIDFDLPLIVQGTDFQKRAWEALKTIPYGQTLSYQAQAIALGDANKVRAVGGANGMNPISIVVPCHRVVAKDGGLGGFGGGLPAKSYLLDHEKKIAQSSPS